MPDLAHIEADIADIASRPKAVRFAEIERVIKQLNGHGYSPRYYKGKEAWVFYVGGEKFTVCDHNRGSAYVKSVYVKKFVGAMINLGLYE